MSIKDSAKMIVKSKRLQKILDYSSKYKLKIKSFFIAVVGFVLSPLSWWNDLFVNIPLAYLFAVPFGFISEKYFFYLSPLRFFIGILFFPLILWNN